MWSVSLIILWLWYITSVICYCLLQRSFRRCGRACGAPRMAGDSSTSHTTTRVCTASSTPRWSHSPSPPPSFPHQTLSSTPRWVHFGLGVDRAHSIWASSSESSQYQHFLTRTVHMKEFHDSSLVELPWECADSRVSCVHLALYSWY